jgi:integrase/recombinase XerD
LTDLLSERGEMKTREDRHHHRRRWPMPILTLTDALEYYETFAIGVENRSEYTVRIKKTAAGQLIQYLGFDPPLKDIQEPHIIGWLQWLRQRPKWEKHPSGNRPREADKDSWAITINTYFRMLRALFNWLVKHKIIETNPMINIEEPEAPEKLPKNLKADQVERILKAIDLRTYAGARDTAMILFIADTGVRASEVVGLKLDDIDTKTREFCVTRKKTKKQEVLGFRKMVAGLLVTYMMHWRPDSPHKELFLTRDGHPITTNRLARILKARGDKIGIHLNPHLLRHTAAIRKRRDEGWDAERIQNLLGHSTSKMTRLYIRAAGDEDLREAFRRPGWVDKLHI